MLHLFIVISGLLLSSFSGLLRGSFLSTAEAKTFSNAYISFNMPDLWNCTLEQTEWVCRSGRNEETKEAIIILTAKEVGPTDSFSSYTQHLNNPVSVQNRGQGGSSQIVYKAKEIRINDQPWLDGLHLGSEVPNYYTRYLATIKDQKIAILITFSSHKMFYDKYSTLFFDAVNTLKVNATSHLLEKIKAGPIGSSGGDLFGTGQPAAALDGAPPVPVKKNSKTNLYIGLAMILAAIGFYIIYKSRNK